jgi:uncharacterized protein YcnI
MRIRSAGALVALVTVLGLAGGANAHAVFADPRATASANYVGRVRISHGCDGSPTVSVRVQVPAGIVGAKAQPKPGWTLTVEREPLAQPQTGEGGKAITERAAAFTWTGRLPEDQFDEFALMAKLPGAPGPLYFPTVQRCESGENRWVEIPRAGQAWGSLPHPAPVVEVQVAAPAADHAHH